MANVEAIHDEVPAPRPKWKPKNPHWSTEQIESALDDGSLVVPEGYLALDDETLKAKHVHRSRDDIMGHGEAPWMAQRRTPRPSAPTCPMCRNVFVVVPGEPCETCWEEMRFDDDPVIGRGSDAPWPDYVAGSPSGSRRRSRVSGRPWDADL